VGDDHDRGAIVGAAAQEGDDLRARRLVELARRLVGEEHARLVRERDRQPGAGQLAARELRGPSAGARGDAAALEHLGPPARAGAAAGAGEALDDREVLVDREVPDEVRLLVQHADAVEAGARPRVLRAARQAAPLDPNHAAVGLVEAGEAREQRGLARPGRAGDRDDLAAVGGQGHAAQGPGLVVAGVEEPVQVDRLEERGRAHPVHRSESVTIRHGSTLSAPRGPLSVRTAVRPPWLNT